MEKRLLALLCLNLLLGASNLLIMTLSWDGKETIRSTPLSERHKYQHANSNSSVKEDTKKWTHTYGGVEDDTVWSIIQTTNSDYIFAGSTGSWPNDKAWLVKINDQGNVQWTQTYNFSSVNTVIPTTDGGFALAGTRGGNLGSPSDAWLMKTDAHGAIQWIRTYKWKDRNNARSVIQSHDGGFVLGGSYNNLNNHSDGWLVKTDYDGNMEWMQTYGGSSNDHIAVVIQTLTGEFAFAGDTWSYGKGNNDCWLVKTNFHGEMEWNRTYGDLGADKAYKIFQVTDGSFFLIGATSSYGAGNFDAWLVKTDVNGTMEWMQTYGGSSHDKAYSGIQTTDGGVVLAGATTSYNVNSEDLDFWLLKLDASGISQWNHTYGDSEDEEVNSVIQTADGGFLLAGRTHSYGTGRWDAWLVKTDALGIAPNIKIPQTNWFVIGLIGSLTLVTIVVVVLYMRNYRRSRKWP